MSRMTRLANLAAIIASVFLSACLKQSAIDSQSNVKAEKLLTNAKVYTVNEGQPWGEAVAIKGNKIIYVGDAKGAAGFVDADTETFDLNGKMVLPGFVSGHDHLIASDWMGYGVQLYDAKSKEEYLQLISDYVKANPDEKVIRGIGWNPVIYGGMPTSQELDAIVSDRPAILLEFTIHDAWLNSKAMEVGGITKETKDPLPGVTYWNRDKDGKPSGTAIEFAWLPTYVASGAWEPEKMIPASQKKNYAAAVASGMTAFLNPGLVTPNLNNPEGMFEDYKVTLELLSQLDQQGELPLRTFSQPLYKNPEADPEWFVGKAAVFAKQYDSERLRSLGIKIHPEGNWSSRTSLMLEPYLPKDGEEVDIERPSPTAYGAAGVRADLMRKIVLAANAKGLDVATHTDGSATVRAMIDAIEASKEAGYSDTRNSLHHLFWAHPDDLQRILDMNLTVNITPNFSTDWTGQDMLAYQLLGEERTKEQLSTYPIVFANGNKVSLSADIPSSPLALIAPLFNMEAAITLQDPTSPDSKVFPPGRKGITLKQAIKGVTIFPAWQIRMESKIGSIEVGKYADLVILEKNLFDVAPRDIAEVKVEATIMDGKFTYWDGI